MSDRATLRNRIITHIGDRMDQNVVINDELNNCLKHLERVSVENLHYVWKDLQERKLGTITSINNLWSHPDDCKTILGINLRYGGLSRPLVEKSQRWMNDRYPYPENNATGTPTMFSQFKRVFQVNPWPSQDFDVEIFYGKTITMLTADTDEPDIADIDDYLVYDTSMRVLYAIGASQRAKELYPLRNAAIKSALSQDASRPGIVTTPGMHDPVWANGAGSFYPTTVGGVECAPVFGGMLGGSIFAE